MKEEAIIISDDNKKFRLHQLKTVEPYYSEVKNGNKTFEVRKFDRDYKIGDFLLLSHYDVQTNKLSGGIYKRITYMLTDKPYVPDGYVILGMVDDQIEISR